MSCRYVAVVEDERVTLGEVARIAGVSIATASRALNERSDVSPETRALVIEVAERSGFRSRRLPKRGGVIAVTVPFVEGSYFAAMLGGIAEAVDAAGMSLLLLPNGFAHARSRALRERLLPESADGAVLMLPPEPVEELFQARRSMSIAVIDPRVPLAEGIPTVAAANSAGADLATSHLLELGHRSIALVTGPVGWAATEERRQGYRAALAREAMAPDEGLVEVGDWSLRSGRDAAGRLLDRSDRPTAIFAFNDEMAIGTMQVARERGLRVPEDLSVVGFDGVERGELLVPQLTTVRQPLAEMGRMAVTLLLRLLEGKKIEALRVELATRLVVRESTAPVAGNPDGK